MTDLDMNGLEAWCQPNYGGKIHPRKFMVVYEDAEVGNVLFDNEADAREHFESATTNWNCYLFGLMPLNATPTNGDDLAEQCVRIANSADGSSAGAKTALREAAARILALEAERDEWERLSGHWLKEARLKLAAGQSALDRATTAEARLKVMQEALRCQITGNPPGTDTHMIGAPPCGCPACSAARKALSTLSEQET